VNGIVLQAECLPAYTKTGWGVSCAIIEASIRTNPSGLCGLDTDDHVRLVQHTGGRGGRRGGPRGPGRRSKARLPALAVTLTALHGRHERDRPVRLLLRVESRGAGARPASHGIELPTAEREEILAAYHELAVFDDVRTPGSVSGPLSEQSLCRILCETEGHTIITLGGSFWPVSCPDFPALLMIGTPHAAYR
jgi:hypothetical protein